MEVLLFALFFISVLIFFIAGKDDFGRIESKLITKGEKNIKERDNLSKEGKKEDKIADVNIEPQEKLKKES